MIMLRSKRVIAAYDGREKGDTVKTIRLVHVMKRELKEIPIAAICIPENIRHCDYQ